MLPQETHDLFTRRAELVAWLIVVGLAVELVGLIWSNRPISEVAIQGIADLLIAGGVGFELWFERIARVAGDTVQAEAKAETAKANASAAALEKEAAEARKRTAEIERLTAWRHISKEQRAKIIAELAGKIPEDIFIESEQEAETHTFAKEIAEIFEIAGTRRIERGINHIMIGSDPLFGVYVAARPEVHAIVIQDAFSKGGVPVIMHPPQLASLMLRPSIAFSGAPIPESSRAHIYVGYRPLLEE